MVNATVHWVRKAECYRKEYELRQQQMPAVSPKVERTIDTPLAICWMAGGCCLRSHEITNTNSPDRQRLRSKIEENGEWRLDSEYIS